MFKDFLLSGEITRSKKNHGRRLTPQGKIKWTTPSPDSGIVPPFSPRTGTTVATRKSEARSYWMELLQDVLQLSDTNDPKTVCFERKTGLNGYIDVLMIKARVLVEQKSLGVDLDKPEKRQGLMLTPIQQAKRYADNLPPSEKPTVLITCNFGLFRIYDLEQDWIASKPQSEFMLADLPNHLTSSRD